MPGQITGDLPGPGQPSRSRITVAAGEASGSVNRFFRLLAQSDPTTMATRPGFMIADAVRYMSLHSWKQPDSYGHSGTSPG